MMGKGGSRGKRKGRIAKSGGLRQRKFTIRPLLGYREILLHATIIHGFDTWI